MEELVNLLVNNGVAVAVVAYFLFRDWKFHDNLQATLQTLIDTVDALKYYAREREVTNNEV